MTKHQLTELATGERVISERVPGVRSVALGFWIGAGSRDEPEARAGVSHFIEHLLFKGSSRYSAQEIAEIFDELGGELNAATSRETTVVYARIPDDRPVPCRISTNPCRGLGPERLSGRDGAQACPSPFSGSRQWTRC